jgi:endonuclease/exonuclease/phosphatase family metal-dependent hydrolase
VVWDESRRKLAARALSEPDGKLPDILCVQEVENLDALRVFNERVLGTWYSYAVLIDSWDNRNMDVGVLSRYPVRELRTHIDDTGPDGQRIFSRDCLEATVELPKGERLTVLVNHFKSKLVIGAKGETPEQFRERLRAAHETRRRQAATVARLVRERFASQPDALYAVVGDFNDTPGSPWLKPLLGSPLLVDVLGKLRPEDCWTYYWRDRNRVTRVDYVLASKALFARIEQRAEKGRALHIERRGLGFRERNGNGVMLPEEVTWVEFEEDPVTPRPERLLVDRRVGFRFGRFEEVEADWRANVSDHCPVKVWF